MFTNTPEIAEKVMAKNPAYEYRSTLPGITFTTRVSNGEIVAIEIETNRGHVIRACELMTNWCISVDQITLPLRFDDCGDAWQAIQTLVGTGLFGEYQEEEQ